MKSIIKEIFIMILMTIAIVLVLGLLLYEYNPISKTTPSKVEAYALPEDIQKELEETITETEKQNIIKTYRIDAQDLKLYEATNDYDKGRKNPFDKIEDENQISNSVTNQGSSGNKNTTNNNSNNNDAPNNNSQGSFLNTVGK